MLERNIPPRAETVVPGRRPAPNFATWSHENLARYASDAFVRINDMSLALHAANMKLAQIHKLSQQ